MFQCKTCSSNNMLVLRPFCYCGLGVNTLKLQLDYEACHSCELQINSNHLGIFDTRAFFLLASI